MKKRIVGIILGALLLSGSSVYASSVEMGRVSVGTGDWLQVTVNESEANWVSDNPDIAYVEDNYIKVNTQGTCVLEDSSSGFKLTLNSNTDSSNKDLKLNFNTEVDEVIPENIDYNTDIYELNSYIEVEKGTEDRLENPDYKDLLQSKLVDGKIKLSKEGNYYVNYIDGTTRKVQVVKPELNLGKIKGYLGETSQLSLKDSKLKTKVSYSSSDESIATVDNNGLVTLKAKGTCKIIASTEFNSLECLVEVGNPDITVDKTTLRTGETGKITVNNNPADLEISYKVIKGTGSVDSSGVVTCLEGTTTVRTYIGNDLYYDTEFTGLTKSEAYWVDMQPAIQESLGTPYVMGGFTPKVALDCSGYVSYVYNTVGLMHGRTTAQGLYDMCKPTDTPNAGDLVFFKGTYDCPNYITHVGIYAGDGMMYHSGSPNKKTSLGSSYWQNHIVGYGTMVNK